MNNNDATKHDERRKHRRAAPTGLGLVLKPAGLFSAFHRNQALGWIDVSEGGLCVLMPHRPADRERFHAHVAHPAYANAFNSTVEVRHVRESKSRPGCYVVGFEFVDPSPMMRMCIRNVVDTGSMPLAHIVAGFQRAS